MGKNLLESMLDIAPFLKELVDEDLLIAVADTSQYLYYRPGDTIDLAASVGVKLKEDELLYKTIKEGKLISMISPKEIFGFPFLSITYPLKESDGTVIGGVGIAKSLQNQSKVEETADKMFSSLQQTSASIEEVASASSELATLVGDMESSINFTNKKIEETDEITKFISNISSKTKLLSLNASIEAARVGELGKGFTVVAEEMRKLSNMSNESANKISNTLLEIQQSIKDIVNKITNTNLIAQSQAAATEEITATLEEITANADILADIAKIK